MVQPAGDAMTGRVWICRADDCPQGQALEFNLDLGQGPEPCFLLHQPGLWRAFRNHCPHTGLSLNWQPRRFLSEDGAWIECLNHGALFNIEDGHCVYGPCRGGSLTQLAVEEDEQGIWIRIKPIS